MTRPLSSLVWPVLRDVFCIGAVVFIVIPAVVGVLS